MAERRHILLIEIAYLKKMLLESRIDFLKQKYIPLILQALEAGRLDLRGITGGQVALPRGEDFDPDVGDDLDTMDFLVRKKNWKDLANNIFDVVAHADPDPQKKNTQWILNLVMKPSDRGGLKLEDLDKVTYYLTLFSKGKNALPVEKRNIMSYKSLNDLYDVVKDLKPVASKGEEKRGYEEEMYKQSRLVMNTPEYRILIPLTQAASCHFGINTQWCTAATDSNNYFDSYTKDGPLYNILEKKTNTRWQYHMATGQFMDEEDRQIDCNEFAQQHYPAARALADDVIAQNPIEFEKISDKQIIIHKWKTMDACVDDIATKDGAQYYKTYVKDESDWMINADFNVSYDDSSARSFLSDLEKKDKELLTKLGQYFYDTYKDEVDIDEVVGEYDPSNYRDIMILDDEVEDYDFRNAVESGTRTGYEVGAQNESINLFTKEINHNRNLVWHTTSKNVEELPWPLASTSMGAKKEWTGEFVWDAPVGFTLTVDEVAYRLDKIGEGIDEIAEDLESQINVKEPYNGFTDYDDESAYDTFVEDIEQFVK